MANFTLTDTRHFPNATVVKAYPKSNWANPGPPSGAPVGSATNEQTMTSGTLTFTGLADGVEYWAVAEVGGSYRYVGFVAGADFAGSAGAAVEDWHVVGDPGEPAFPTGFENPDGTGAEIPAWLHSEDAPVAFFKDPFGVVHVRGMALFQQAFVAAPPEGEPEREHAWEERLFTLPAGYRPPAVCRFASGYELSPTSHTAAEIVLAIHPDGRLGDFEALTEPTNPGIGSISADKGTGIWLDGISFRAA